ncbi:MAG: glycosyltransferase [Chitinophagaceae bacterium]
MDLSIIIVNYNVKHFLEQCLYSVQKANAGIQAEVIVVDNHSVDNSIDYLQPNFPTVKFVVNSENVGFAKACNQGLQLSTGKYILFLNPDTIVPEDCFQQCISFLNSHIEIGAIGIKMLDGRGNFLKESKRSFPSPSTSLYKLFGLARLFPKSKTFSSYHLGHLDEKQNHEVDVLAGAFMMIKKEVLDKTGGFDETFFMYGEDVDLSFRIQKAGYKNYYFAENCILHFKGESTRKGSMNYVRMFYKAMSIFVKKHYGGSRAGIFNALIHAAIWIRAGLTAIGHFIRRVGLPLIDAALILFSFWAMKNIWNGYVKTGTQYENRLLFIALPVFTFIYLLTAYYAGLYDRWYKRSELVSSTLIATVVLLAVYALLPEEYRFSRGIILFGALLSFILISLLRWILIKTSVLSATDPRNEHANTLVIASASEYDEVVQLVKEAGMQEKILGRVAVNEQDKDAIGYWSRTDMLFQSVPYREAIFCEGTLTFRNIIDYLQQVDKSVKIKIHAAGSHSIVGSDSKDSAGESVSKENGFKLADPYNRRLKRLVDVSISLFAIISFPVHFIGVKKPLRFFANCFAVLFAQKTWVGYATIEKNLPALRNGVMACNGIPVSVKQELPRESLQMVDYWYARDYEPANDMKLVWKMYRKLGGQ